jgi:hypothetical protein
MPPYGTTHNVEWAMVGTNPLRTLFRVCFNSTPPSWPETSWYIPLSIVLILSRFLFRQALFSTLLSCRSLFCFVPQCRHRVLSNALPWGTTRRSTSALLHSNHHYLFTLNFHICNHSHWYKILTCIYFIPQNWMHDVCAKYYDYVIWI